MAKSKSCSFSQLRIRKVVPIYFTMIGLFLTLFLVSLHGTSPVSGPFPYNVPLDPQGSLQLFWNVSYTEKVVYFQILIKDLKFGMIFGMSDRGEFEGADLAVLWSDGRNSYFGDAWSDDDGLLHIDSHQDYQLLLARKAPEGLYLIFRRPFSTCDPRDYLIEDGTVHIIYALLERPFQSLSAINISTLHRGLQRVQLLKSEVHMPRLPNDVITMDVRAPNVLIPDKETTYWCYITELPRHFSKHHIVMYEPVITKGHEAIVHHIEVFQCADEYDAIPHYSGPCDSKMKPETLNYCRHVLAAWAMGAQAFYYPKDVGLPFGGPGSSRFLRLEVHYHNPLELKGLRDSSGIRLHYTPSLRLFDAGIMELGLVYTPVMAIPPRQKDFVLTGYCTDKCTQTGDQLITSCSYNTEDRSGVTVGGFSITDEMCVNYIHYYPRTELELCKSHVDPGYLRKYFNLVNRFSGDEVCTCPQAAVTEQFGEVPWNSFSSEVLDALYGYSPISMHCNKSSALRYPGEWEKQPLPHIKAALPPVDTSCPPEDAATTGPTFVKV
ncbi:dopamine beta-hydroxylase isoform X1 [Pseudophryne corroboree]|uniref:dopamine beta-hydroxylase isoform X1 n=1 Tax=Pseudophryne corroboree TaxID=495146 RepID=UPI00308145D0